MYRMLLIDTKFIIQGVSINMETYVTILRLSLFFVLSMLLGPLDLATSALSFTMLSSRNKIFSSYDRL